MRKPFIAAAAGVLAMPFAGLLVMAPANALPCDGIIGSTAGNYACQACMQAHPPTVADPVAGPHNCASPQNQQIPFPDCQGLSPQQAAICLDRHAGAQ